MRYNGILILLIFLGACTTPDKQDTKISLGEWSLHKALLSGELDHLDFAQVAADSLQIYKLDYVNQFFQDKIDDQVYLQKMKQAQRENGCDCQMIMIDNEGELGITDDDMRARVIQNHFKWIDLASFLGCDYVRVNANGRPSEDMDEVSTAIIKSLIDLNDYASKKRIKVLVENHGMMINDSTWSNATFSTTNGNLAKLFSRLDLDHVAALPDYGNFHEYDIYQGLEELMPYAASVSIKAHSFDEDGDLLDADFDRIMDIIQPAEFEGTYGIEFESETMNEIEGIRKTKNLILRYLENEDI